MPSLTLLWGYLIDYIFNYKIFLSFSIISLSQFITMLTKTSISSYHLITSYILYSQGAKKVILKAETTIILAPKTFWWAELISQFFCNLNSSKNFTCPLGKLRKKFTSPIAKSTNPGLSDTTFFYKLIHFQLPVLEHLQHFLEAVFPISVRICFHE